MKVGFLALTILSAVMVKGLMMPSMIEAADVGRWTEACVGGKEDTLAGDVATIQGIECLLANLLGAVLTLFAFVGFFMFIMASFKLMVSSGKPEEFSKAKDTMTYAIFGFILALSSFMIINILAYFTGIESFLVIRFGGQTVETSISK